ncbi:MAG: hypothetical protein E6K24_01165, partial [Gammaproteobacteria bacterium]
MLRLRGLDLAQGRPMIADTTAPIVVETWCNEWSQLDFLLHTVAFAAREVLAGSLVARRRAGRMIPKPLFGARALADWVFARGSPQRRIPAHRWRATWHAWWFEHHWHTEESRLARLPLPADPLFITGLWRSGTTAMHELLHAASGWPTPLTWQCFNPSTCFLTGPPREDASVSRPMDRGRIAALGAQEDEFALLLLGEPSVY